MKQTMTLGLMAAMLALPATAGTLSGTALYRERMALPPDTVFEARLLDTSATNKPARIIGHAGLNPAGHPPYDFSIIYDDKDLEAGRQYVVEAVLERNGQVLFAGRTAQIPLPGHTDNVQLLLKRGNTPATAPTPPGIADAPLRNTYWKLVSLKGKPTIVGEQRREPHLVFSESENRVSGNGGCNGIGGGFESSGEKLNIKGLVSTMMACQDTMQQESEFLRALETVAGYKIHGNRLDMLDAEGNVLASYMAVALQ